MYDLVFFHWKTWETSVTTAKKSPAMKIFPPFEISEMH